MNIFEGAKVKLRPLNPDDYMRLFEWHSDMSNLHLWWADRKIMSFENFIDDLRNRLERFFGVILIIESKEQEGVPIGMVYSYNVNQFDGYSYVCTYLAPQYTAKRLGSEASFIFADYLFTYFPFRKLYAEIFSYNELSLRAAQVNGGKVEGVLKAHRWFGNSYCDLHLLALYREDFENAKAAYYARAKTPISPE